MQLTGLRTVLCLGAHADDIEIGCGGTLLRLSAENPGLEVHWVVLSAGGERETEARNSANALLATAGTLDVRVAGFRENYFPYIGAAVKDYAAELALELAPDVVFTHWCEDLHQDHRLVSELTWNTIRGPLILEYEIPKWDGDMGRPNVFVPLDRSFCTRKVEHLLRAFPSQAGKDWYSADTFWGILRLRGVEARSPSGFAEAFHCRKLVLE